MKFLDINGVKSLWNRLGTNVIDVEVTSEDGYNNDDDRTALYTLYTDLLNLVGTQKLNTLNDKKIHIINFISNDVTIAKVTILQRINIDSSGLRPQQANNELLCLITLRSGSNKSMYNMYYGELQTMTDTFSIYPFASINNVIEI